MTEIVLKFVDYLNHKFTFIINHLNLGCFEFLICEFRLYDVDMASNDVDMTSNDIK